MKVTDLVSFRVLRTSQYWLLGSMTALVAAYLTLVRKSGDTAHLGMSILFYLAAGMLLWEKRDRFRLGGGAVSKLIGILLIGFAFWLSVGLPINPALTDPVPNPALRLFPFISALGIGLLASGFKKLKQYGQELILLFFLGAPSVFALFLPDPSPVTAKFSAFLLWYVGFNAAVQDVYISLPTGSVKVYAACSGVESMTYLLGLSVISVVMFPVARIKQVFIPILAMFIGFFVNAVRVALMAVLAASQNKVAFDYWHEGDGSLIFGVVAVLLFGLCYWFLYRQPSSEEF
ncbi:MAG: cyanoexosortase A [Cyanobacteria bacterium CRU_2_1]|nr:cyanoexosortase A [Cyanobacteria bacterium CRU_2_1]